MEKTTNGFELALKNLEDRIDSLMEENLDLKIQLTTMISLERVNKIIEDVFHPEKEKEA